MGDQNLIWETEAFRSNGTSKIDLNLLTPAKNGSFVEIFGIPTALKGF